MKRVAIIHPWYPQYREAFFEDLVRTGHENGLSIEIFHGNVPPEWGKRGDAITSDAATLLDSKFFKLGGKYLIYKSLRVLMARESYDLVILEQAVRNLETYMLLLTRYRRKIAFWGHGKTYTQRSSFLQEALKRRLTLSGCWFFAYTRGGAAAVEQLGFRSQRITVVNNSVDTKGIRSSIASLSASQVYDFRSQYDLGEKVALFIGGLDQSKRIPFLLEAAKKAHEIDDDFRLVVIGDGVQRQLITDAAADNPWIVYLGHTRGDEKALALAASKIFAMPGRVGLVAVDSFAAAVPVVTTDWPWHAPEFEYLEPGVNALITRNSADAFAEEMVTLLSNRERLIEMQKQCRLDSDQYSVERMSRNFLEGIESALLAQSGNNR